MVRQNTGLRRAWLSSLGWKADAGDADAAVNDAASARYDAAFDRLADEVENALDMSLLDSLIES